MSTRNLDAGPLIALLAALALALGLAACSRSDETASPRLAARTPAQPDAASSQAPASQGVQAQGTISAQTSDPTGATDAGDKANSAETAKGTDPPMKSMDKDEESKAMPQPGQANDHSTLAQDPKTPN
jgi:hypothetical protein